MRDDSHAIYNPMKSIILRVSLAVLVCFGTQEISAQNLINIIAEVNDLSCHSADGLIDGSIDIRAEGGAPPYTYAWTGDGVNTVAQNQNSLAAGTYNLIITDANGLTEEAEFTLVMPEQLLISVSLLHPECNTIHGESNGSIDITASGGLAPYTFTWTGPDVCNTCEDQTGLSTGTYCVTLTDVNNCETTKCFDLTEPVALQIVGSISELSCNGSNGTSDGHIDITISGSTPPYTYQWTGLDVAPIDQDQWMLGAGTYCVTVTDVNGCEKTECYTLIEPEVIGVLADVTHPKCSADGYININVTGGTSPYTYEWSNGYIGSNNSNLSAGNYTLSVTDGNGCNWETSYDLISESFTVEYRQTNLNCQNQSADYEIIVTGVSGPYALSYTTTGGTIGNLDNNLDQAGGIALASNIEIGHIYTIDIIDNEGCTQSISIDAQNSIETALEVPRLCLVTNSADGHIQVLWEDGISSDNVTKHNIYRETSSSGTYVKIATIQKALDNSYLDEEADHTARSYQYYVTASDDCGNESEPSSIHKTIHLQIGQGVGGHINLQWDAYIGVDYNSVKILRGASSTDLEEYVTLPSNIFTFTDNTPLSGDVFYQVVIGAVVDCNINKGLYELKSNVAALIETSTQEIDWSESIYPNPVSETLNIDLEQPAHLTIINTKGQEIRQIDLQKGSNQIVTSDLDSGLYFLQFLQGRDVFVTRLLRE